jgi:cytochrome c553
MAKKSTKRTAKRTAATKQTAKKSAPRAKPALNLLRVIHGAITHHQARPILGRLSSEDLDLLAKHGAAGTLMPGITPIADTASKSEAIKAMPSDIGQVVAKLSDDDVANLRGHLQRLPRDKANAAKCGC